MAGEVIAGRFELMEHIAGGGSGSVWLARDLQCSRRCAAKVMRQSYSGEILRFVREQGVKFDHPNLLTPYGWAAVDDRVVIASQLMRGGNLHTAMQDYGAFSVPLVAEILAQLLQGLEHVHAAGWVHRDVKPANVLLELTGTAVPRVRLTDFGIAAHRDDPRLTRSGATVGTEGFLAPQQRAGADPEPAQDLYALGVLGMQLLDPTLHGDELRTRSRALAANSLLVPAPLGPVLAGLLGDDPRRREQVAAEAVQKLAPLRNPEGYTVASGEVFEVFDHFAENGEAELADTEGAPSAAGPAPEPSSASTVPRTRPEPPGKPGPTRKTGAHWQPWAFLAAALLLGLLSLWLIFANPGDPDSAGTPAPEPTEALTSASPTPAPTAAPSPSRDAPTTAGSPTAPRATISGTPLDAGISSNVRTGQRCTVLEAGLIVTGADGHTLTCEPDGAGHAWTAGN